MSSSFVFLLSQHKGASFLCAPVPKATVVRSPSQYFSPPLKYFQLYLQKQYDALRCYFQVNEKVNMSI